MNVQRSLLNHRLWLILLALVAWCACAPAGALAQDEEQAEEPAEASDDETAAEEADAEEDEDRYFAVIGARVHTVTGGVLDGATVLCRNGRIAEIGPNVNIPDGAEVLDASGHEMYPGLIAVRSRGILGGGRPDDSTDVFNLDMTMGLVAGITTAVSGNTAAKLTFGTVDDMIVKRDVFESLRYSTSSPNARRVMRNQLDRVQKYLRDLARYEEEKNENPDAEKPDDRWIRGNYQKYLRLLKGEAVALIDADTTHDLLQVCELAEDYGIRFVVDGAVEGWTVAPQLGRAGAGAIITPRERRDPDEEIMRRNGSTIENARRLHNHGVTIAFIPPGSLFGPGDMITYGGLAGRDLLHLTMEAAFAVRGGMPDDAAVRALTLGAAKILGIDDRVGSIEVGKDADFVICDGDLLHYMTLTRWTIVNGRVVYDKQKESLFEHVRPGGDVDAPPPDDYWPRRLGEGVR